ncbi:MAG: DUF4380 domain-containing protein, partial [Candidatus Latescibacteria bacterium]|nr:DUF4380 domain-containing protein [Candidatus Latescibacterota bacterium]
MSFINVLRKIFILIAIMSLCLCSCDKDAERKERKTSARRNAPVLDESFHSWDSLTLRNSYIRFDVVPDLGGKIMGYALHGYQVLWHDSAREGDVDTDQGYGFGEKLFNPGGAKVWTAPQGWSGQDEWPGPPDNVLDSASYEYSLDGKIIEVISPEDDGSGRTGIQFKHTYSLTPVSTIANLNLSMTNVVDRTVKWGLWHIATVPVDRDFTVYVPVDKGNWHVIYGDEDNPQWLGVEDGLFRARYEKLVGKVGMKVREGWAAWHDEVNNIAYAMMFPVDKGAEYPDGGSNFEIWTNGLGTIQANNREHSFEYSPESAMMELEVMGPLARLAPDRSSELDVRWAMCRCSGVKRVISAGVIVEELAYKDGNVTGRLGTFYGGRLKIEYFN